MLFCIRKAVFCIINNSSFMALHNFLFSLLSIMFILLLSFFIPVLSNNYTSSLGWLFTALLWLSCLHYGLWVSNSPNQISSLAALDISFVSFWFLVYEIKKINNKMKNSGVNYFILWWNGFKHNNSSADLISSPQKITANKTWDC